MCKTSGGSITLLITCITHNLVARIFLAIRGSPGTPRAPPSTNIAWEDACSWEIPSSLSLFHGVDPTDRHPMFDFRSGLCQLVADALSGFLFGNTCFSSFSGRFKPPRKSPRSPPSRTTRTSVTIDHRGSRTRGVTVHPLHLA